MALPSNSKKHQSAEMLSSKGPKLPRNELNSDSEASGTGASCNTNCSDLVVLRDEPDPKGFVSRRARPCDYCKARNETHACIISSENTKSLTRACKNCNKNHVKCTSNKQSLNWRNVDQLLVGHPIDSGGDSVWKVCYQRYKNRSSRPEVVQSACRVGPPKLSVKKEESKEATIPRSNITSSESSASDTLVPAESVDLCSPKSEAVNVGLAVVVQSLHASCDRVERWLRLFENLNGLHGDAMGDIKDEVDEITIQIVADALKLESETRGLLASSGAATTQEQETFRLDATAADGIRKIIASFKCELERLERKARLVEKYRPIFDNAMNKDDAESFLHDLHPQLYACARKLVLISYELNLAALELNEASKAC